jgi:hypothetical protein
MPYAAELDRQRESTRMGKYEVHRRLLDARLVSLVVLLSVAATFSCATGTQVAESRWSGAPDAVESRNESLPELEVLPCDREPTLRSTSGDVPASVRFLNQRTEPIELIWLDYDGKRKSYGAVPAGSTHEQKTFLTHPWIIATSSGTCLEIRVPRAARYRVTIR